MFRRLTLFLLLFAGPLRAAPGPMVIDARSPRSVNAPVTASLTRLEATCNMRGALAHTSVLMTLAVEVPGQENPPRMEAGLSFYLPSNCVITGASLDIGNVMRRASLTFRETAQAAYQSVVSRQLDPVLITMEPDGMIRIKVFPILPGAPRHVQLEFSQILTPTPEGLLWEFPLRLPQPVPEVSLITDAPHLPQHGSSIRQNFTGGAEWTLTAPLPPADGVWPAQPDQTGIFHFQALLPPGQIPPAPRHLLLIADASAMQREGDTASERRFLTELIRRMGAGRITLAAYDSLPLPNREFPVKDGTCSELFQALDALTYDGAPRPGLLKLASIPADLTVVIGSLEHPMDRHAQPAMPEKAPVMVMDSVSSGPSSLALHLAGGSGGAVFNPRSSQPPVFFPGIPLDGRYFSMPVFYLLPDQSAWFVTARLTGMTLTPPDPESLPLPAKGNDVTAGQLTTLHRGRGRLFDHLRDAPGSLRHRLPPEWASSPYLSARTGFIVLEELSQYTQFNIPLPPDLAGQDIVSQGSSIAALTDFDWVGQALLRSPGRPASMEKWRQQLTGWKLKSLTESQKKLIEFQQHRSPIPAEIKGMEDYISKEYYMASLQHLGEANRLIPQLAARYPAAEATARPDLVRMARALQQAKVAMMEIFSPEMWGGMMRSGGYTPSANPFTAEQADLQQFFGGGAAADSSPTDPFGGDSAAGLDSGAAPKKGTETQARLRGAQGVTDPAALTPLAKISAAAQALHRAGRQDDALRTLSNLAAQPQPDHGALRFLAWQLLEWNQSRAALGVLQQADFLHGPTPITRRDLALIKAEFPPSPPDNLKILDSLPLGVARREAAGLQGHGSAALRVVLECADETADADLEIDGPDFETASWKNPLPTFGGALSFDGKGFTPEDFMLPAAPTAALTVRVRLHAELAAPLRVTIFRNWAGADAQKQVILLPACPPGLTTILEFPPG